VLLICKALQNHSFLKQKRLGFVSKIIVPAPRADRTKQQSAVRGGPDVHEQWHVQGKRHGASWAAGSNPSRLSRRS
jgi:hypothetical protein